jgi:hypothetical protein
MHRGRIVGEDAYYRLAPGAIEPAMARALCGLRIGERRRPAKCRTALRLAVEKSRGVGT